MTDDPIDRGNVRAIREALSPEMHIVGLGFEPRLAAAPAHDRMTNATWRLLEERRMDAVEAIAEIDAQIHVLQMKRADAVRSAAMCEAAQKVGAP